MVDLPAILPDFSTEATYAFTSCSEAALLVTRTWSELSSPLYANKFLKTVESLAANARMSAQENSVRAFPLQCCFNLINDFKSSSRVSVRVRSLLTAYAPTAVQQYRCITPPA
nr:hypothetical protein Iba_chr02aCG6500 [Ipomoea batatas]